MTDHAVTDIHAHFRGPGQPIPTRLPWMPEQRWREHEQRYEQTASFDAIVEASDAAGVDVRVLSLPASARFADFDMVAPSRDEIERLNDYLADGVRDHSGRLLGLATVDAFSGDAGGAEVRRAIDELDLSGVAVDSARADVFLGAPETIPTLEEAARLGVPVLVHPTTTSLMPVLADQARQLGISYGRGLANGMALLTMMHRGVFDRIVGLRTVFTTLGLGALGIAGTWRARDGLAASDGRWNVSFDTMGFDGANIAFLVSVLGPRRVVLGSDFPHQVDATTERVATAFREAGISPADQERIRGANAAELVLRRPATNAT